MVLTALRQVNEWGPENIQNYVSSISEQPIQELISRGFWVEDKEFRGSHLFGVRVPPGTDLELIRQKCETQNVFVSIRGSAIRVAPHIYNDAHDFEKLIQSLS
jgi:selenocysteine lyase/cysteine desulfurase